MVDFREQIGGYARNRQFDAVSLWKFDLNGGEVIARPFYNI